MKSFRRILFCAIAATMLAVQLIWMFTDHSNGPWARLLIDSYLGSPLAMLVRCAGFLDVEPILARTGIIAVLVIVVVAWLNSPIIV
jgi:hypothetical protein